MAVAVLRRRFFLQSRRETTGKVGDMFCISALDQQRSCFATSNDAVSEAHKSKKGKWFTLPAFTPVVDASSLGKVLSGHRTDLNTGNTTAGASTTALKWVVRCCPQLPRSLVQKLFRLRQVWFSVSMYCAMVCNGKEGTIPCKANFLLCSSLQVRRESYNMITSDIGVQNQEHRLKRVAAKDLMNLGDQILLPITVEEFPSEKHEYHCNDEEINFVHNLELYKDPAIIVVNKPPGLPVQGGIGIKRSLDELAATYLRYDCSEPPRLVHRLDRDSSGILIMGRTQTSATILHSIFREKTFGASNNDIDTKKRILQRRYWALVIGSPRRPRGLISAPLGKVGIFSILSSKDCKFPLFQDLTSCSSLIFIPQVVVDDGKSERITIVDNVQTMSSQHAITEYRVIKSSCHGYTWLELSPLTGRKHQLRVHCAEVLGTPIVGDYKYGWQAHRKWKQLFQSNIEKNLDENLSNRKTHPFGLDLESGSILDKQPHLHLHCKQMVLPNVSLALQNLQLSAECDLSELESLEFVAPLPSHMQRSWDILNS
ncbi:RNA pseudouridine synthase 4, mitochondrial [Vitis vinifera]|uniref:RNA pseudouridine synthase 4, mitochondrial n=1 Tax=Vitis vinifera TaxID=29760 RepID=A0A438FN69_VITVI|nr:RNA pseudouridine synthase 4, mitochondrial [Vitis vinifera]